MWGVASRPAARLASRAPAWYPSGVRHLSRPLEKHAMNSQRPRPPAAAGRQRQALLSSSSSPVVDGMTRYPEFTSIKGLLRASDYFGTVIFAISGSVTAGMAGMDLLGCSVVGTITAVGGGTIRDLLIGNSPVFWMVETEYLWMCLATTAATFFGWKSLQEQHGMHEDHPFLVWGDALGVGAFAVIGCQNGLRKGLPAIICLVCGVCTATFGGMTRDVLCRRPPRILHSHAEVYATTAAAGAGTYLAVRAMGGPLPLRILSGVSTAIFARYLAWTHGIRLPVFDFLPTPSPAKPQQP